MTESIIRKSREAKRGLSHFDAESFEHLKNKKELDYLSAFDDEYVDDGTMDPAGYGATDIIDVTDHDRINVLFDYERERVDRVVTMDIETAGLNPQALAIGVIYDPENPYRKRSESEGDFDKLHQSGETNYPYTVARHWHNQYDLERYQKKVKGHKIGDIKRDEHGNVSAKSVQKGLIEYIEDILLELPFGKDEPGQKIHLYAHNFVSFEGTGLAHSIVSNFEVDPAYAGKRKNEILDDQDRIRHQKYQFFSYGSPDMPWRNLTYHYVKSIDYDYLLTHVKGLVKTTIKIANPKNLYYGDPDVAPFRRAYLWDSGVGSDTSASVLHRRRTVKHNRKKGRVRTEITDGIGESYILTWKVKPNGATHYIEVTISKKATQNGGTKHKLLLLDSMSHMPVGLSSIADKGKTPLKFTNPEKWTVQEIKAGRLNVKGLSEKAKKEKIWDYWHENAATQEDIEYCKQDCKGLYDALIDYRETYGEIVKHPEYGYPIDPLAYLTSTQAAKAAMIITSIVGQSSEDRLEKAATSPLASDSYLTGYFGSRGVDEIGRPLPAQNVISDMTRINNLLGREDVVLRKVPYFPSDGSIGVCFGGWYQYGKYMERYRPIRKGGRNDLFQIMTGERMRKVSIDKNSMYASMQSDDNLWYPDPRFLRDLKEPIRGRQAILAFLQKYGGVFRITTTQAVNPIIRDKFPIFPIEMMGSEQDTGSVFANWSDERPIKLTVSGEELKHFLEQTEVLNDDIEIQTEGTCYSNLIHSSRTPFYHFSKRFFALRQRSQRLAKKHRKEADRLGDLARQAGEAGDAEKAEKYLARQESERRLAKKYDGKSTFAKMQLVSGGFGVLLQQNRESVLFTEGRDQENYDNLMRLKELTRTWIGWERVTKDGIVSYYQDGTVSAPQPFGSPEALKLAADWAATHFHSWKRCDVDRELNGANSKIRRVMVKMPSKMAPHSIPAFGCSITAHARVDLHRAIMAVDSIRNFGVMYCDTDSVHFQVPEWMSNEEVMRKLEQAKVVVNGKPQQVISLGENLGQWKVEGVDPNPQLVSENDPGIDTNNVTSIFLAPKVYFNLSQPIKETIGGKTYEHRKLIKETVKGISKRSIAMRISLMSLYVSQGRLGDPRGLNVETKVATDLTQNIEKGTFLKRIYDKPDELSRPITICQPDEETKYRIARERRSFDPHGPVRSWAIYTSEISKQSLKQCKPDAIREALRYYMYNVKVGDRYINDIRRESLKAIDQFNEDLMKDIGKGQMMHANYILEKLRKATLISSSDYSDPQGTE